MGTQVGGVAILETQEAAVAHGAVTPIQVGAVTVEAIIGQLTPTPSIAVAAPARLLLPLLVLFVPCILFFVFVSFFFLLAVLV